MLANAVAFTVTISLAPLAVIEVAAEPVVMLMPLSAASPVVTVSAPVREPAAISPTSPVTVSAAEPISVSAVFCASAVAFTVTVSVLKLSVIEVAAEPVVIDMVLSVASPVVTVSAPVREPAVMFPISPVTTSAAEPTSVSAILLANAAALTLSVTPLESVMLVAPVPVITYDAGAGRVRPQRDGACAGQPQRLDTARMQEVGVGQCCRRRHLNGVIASAASDGGGGAQIDR